MFWLRVFLADEVAVAGEDPEAQSPGLAPPLGLALAMIGQSSLV
jgi:hypothetical protein